MNLTPEQKENVTKLIDMGKMQDAVIYLQEKLNITPEDATVLAEKLNEEAESPKEEKVDKLFRDIGRVLDSLITGRAIGVSFMLLGALFVALSANMIISNQHFEQRAMSVKGKVIGYNKHLSTDDDGVSTLMYTPTFRYEVNGKTYTQPSDNSANSETYKINETVDLLVDPQNPKQYVINSFTEQWDLPMVFGIMGIAFVMMGFLVFRKYGRTN